MKTEYIVTNDYLQQTYNLNLNDYCLEGCTQPVINKALFILIRRICKLNDDIKSESAIENYLSTSDSERTAEDKKNAFINAQYEIIDSLIFRNENDPQDDGLDDIIVFQLGLGKINGFQKGIYRKQSQGELL